MMTSPAVSIHRFPIRPSPHGSLFGRWLPMRDARGAAAALHDVEPLPLSTGLENFFRGSRLNRWRFPEKWGLAPVIIHFFVGFSWVGTLFFAIHWLMVDWLMWLVAQFLDSFLSGGILMWYIMDLWYT